MKTSLFMIYADVLNATYFYLRKFTEFEMNFFKLFAHKP